MMRLKSILLICCALATAGAQRPPDNLQITFVDVEGGQATLIVSPSGQSMLVDAGYPGFKDRDAIRIAEAIKQAGLEQIDYLVVTHYHSDHVGGVPAIAARVPIKTFVDHGPTMEESTAALYKAYVDARSKGAHLQVRPGDTIPIAGIDVRVVSSNGDLIGSALPGGGEKNPLCASFAPQDVDVTENARSVGFVLTFGQFRMLDLGDLTWNKERDLVCPDNRLGPIDLYLTTHHGLPTSGPAVLVHAIRPRVAIMNNGSKKGGSAQAWQIVRDAPGLEDFWQLHYSVDAGASHNITPPFIANMDETTAHNINVYVRKNGTFFVVNERDTLMREYEPKAK
jgi:beta-lactamase superfamily II metal-dependent hydrolase